MVLSLEKNQPRPHRIDTKKSRMITFKAKELKNEWWRILYIVDRFRNFETERRDEVLKSYLPRFSECIPSNLF